MGGEGKMHLQSSIFLLVSTVEMYFYMSDQSHGELDVQVCDQDIQSCSVYL